MSDPFRSELEAAHQRIAKLESDHKARVTELERENARLRKRLVDAAPPSQSKTGKTFFALGMTTLGVSLAAGMFFARMAPPPAPTPIQLLPTQAIELSAETPTPTPEDDFNREEARKALAAIRIDECSSDAFSGHAKITFATTGFVSEVLVDPPLDKTPIGKCVARVYANARIPPFSGAPRVVGKAFFK
jgi:hypothetical protein